jgi:hypothetical protein
MKELDFPTLFAVFHEMLGPLLWVLVALAGLATLAFCFVLLRDRGLVSRRLVWAEAIGLAGGVGAVLFTKAVTQARFAYLGGPIDWLLLAAIFVLGTIGTALGVYAALGVLFRRLA